MKKILVVGMSHNPGGVESVIMNYYRNVNKNTLNFDFLVQKDYVAYKDEIKSLGGNIIKISTRRKFFKYKKDMKNFFKNHAHEYEAVWDNKCTLSNLDFLKYAKKYGIKKTIIHAHNSKPTGSILSKVLHIINKRRVKKIATNYWSCSEEASNYFYNKKIKQSVNHKIINNAIDLKKYSYNAQVREEYRKKFNVENKLVIGNVGRLHFQKNQTFLLDIFNSIVKQHPNTKLFLVGQGEDEQMLREKVNALNLINHVDFLGVRTDIEKLYQMFDAFVLPSLFEGLPVVLVEAQASALPIFAADTISSKSKITNNFHFLSLQDSPEVWAQTILNNLQNNRKNNENELSETEYNIKTQARMFEKEILD